MYGSIYLIRSRITVGAVQELNSNLGHFYNVTYIMGGIVNFNFVQLLETFTTSQAELFV